MRVSKSMLVVALIAAAAPLNAQEPMQVAPSGRGTSQVTLTLVDSVARAAAKPSIIKIDYGQPHLRGRKLLTDSLVPYDKIWRLGANAATTLTTDVDIVLGGKTLPKGTYELQTIPSRNGWKLIVQKDGTRAALPQEAQYDPTKDIAQIDMRQTMSSTPVESLTMWLIPSRAAGKPSGQLVIAWGTVSLAIDWVQR